MQIIIPICPQLLYYIFIIPIILLLYLYCIYIILLCLFIHNLFYVHPHNVLIFLAIVNMLIIKSLFWSFWQRNANYYTYLSTVIKLYYYCTYYITIIPILYIYYIIIPICLQFISYTPWQCFNFPRYSEYVNNKKFNLKFLTECFCFALVVYSFCCTKFWVIKSFGNFICYFL